MHVFYMEPGPHAGQADCFCPDHLHTPDAVVRSAIRIGLRPLTVTLIRYPLSARHRL